MRSPAMLVFLVILIAPAPAGAQDPVHPATSAPPPQGAPAPADTKARAPAKSRNFFGQAMMELTRSVDASRASGAPGATSGTPADAASVAGTSDRPPSGAPTLPAAMPARTHQVQVAQDPVD
jgi:hypothetical protein